MEWQYAPCTVRSQELKTLSPCWSAPASRSRQTGMLLVKLGDVITGYPRSLLRALPLPVNRVLETPTTATGVSSDGPGYVERSDWVE